MVAVRIDRRSLIPTYVGTVLIGVDKATQGNRGWLQWVGCLREIPRSPFEIVESVKIIPRGELNQVNARAGGTLTRLIRHIGTAPINAFKQHRQTAPYAQQVITAVVARAKHRLVLSEAGNGIGKEARRKRRAVRTEEQHTGRPRRECAIRGANQTLSQIAGALRPAVGDILGYALVRRDDHLHVQVVVAAYAFADCQKRGLVQRRRLVGRQRRHHARIHPAWLRILGKDKRSDSGHQINVEGSAATSTT